MQSSNQAKLFIYIPSCNRGTLLEYQLDTLALQIGGFRDRVRILVSDNHSTDPAYSLLKGKYKDSLNISFRANPGNIGGNANITLGFVFANSDEYLWILSDDDKITHTALKEIFSALDQEPDFVHIGNYDGLKEETLTLDNLFSLPSGAGFGLISVVIFKVTFINDHIIAGFDYLESSFPHLALVMDALRAKGSARLFCTSHEIIFTGEMLETHGTGDYAISALGFGYLADFMDKSEKEKFLWDWISSTWKEFFAARDKYPSRFYKAYGYIGSSGLRFSLFLGATRLITALSKLRRGLKA